MTATTAPAIGTSVTTLNEVFLLPERTILVDFNDSGLIYQVETTLDEGDRIIALHTSGRKPTIFNEREYNEFPTQIRGDLDMRIVFIPTR
jgi:hypothetical protein